MSARPSPQFTILVIDDDPVFLEMVSSLLSNDGYRVFTAARGEDGLMVTNGVDVDLILLDYYMPGMDGRAVLERLKAAPRSRRIPVVALTSATAEHANELTRAGCIGFIPKPLVSTEFLRLIGQFLHVTSARSRSGEPHA